MIHASAEARQGLPETGHNGAPFNIRNAIAIAASSLAMLGVNSDKAGATDATPAASEPNPHLVGRVAPSATRAIKKSSVQLTISEKGKEGVLENCSGNYITLNGKRYISTAEHCVSGISRAAGMEKSRATYTGAYDVSSQLKNFTVKITNPSPFKVTKKYKDGSRITTPNTSAVAVAKTLLIDPTNDSALMTVKSRKSKHNPGLTTRTPLNQSAISARSAPKTGQPMFQYGASSINNSVSKGGIGTFIGRYTEEDGRTVDLVGLNASSRKKDTCYFGYSGGGSRYDCR